MLEKLQSPARRIEVVARFENITNTPFTAAFFALFAERYECTNCCEALNLEQQFTPGIAAEKAA